MTVLVGGAFAFLLGLILLIVWWSHFITVLAGAIPLILLAGGALAAYLGWEELKDSKQIEKEMATNSNTNTSQQNSEVDRYKKETEKYKAEVEELKKKISETED